MVRPRKIPKNYVPVEWTDSEREDSIIPDVEDDVQEAPESESDASEEPAPFQDFPDLVEDLAKEWLLLEMSHNVSKKASDLFWELSKRMLARLMESGCPTKMPSFTHIRRQLVNKYCPDIKIDMGFKKKDTGEIVAESDMRKVPITQYRKPAYDPLYEIASVNVSTSH